MGTQREKAVEDGFFQTVECDDLGFLRAEEATQIASSLPGVKSPLKVHV